MWKPGKMPMTALRNSNLQRNHDLQICFSHLWDDAVASELDPVGRLTKLLTTPNLTVFVGACNEGTSRAKARDWQSL
jgi:hypothetical protein